MVFFITLLVILMVFIIIMIIGSVMQFSIFICNKKKIEFGQIILPSFLSIISFSLIIYITSFILSKFDINILTLMYNFLLKLDLNFSNLIYALFSYLASFILFTVVQAFFIKLIYIDYSKLFKNICEFILSIFRKNKSNGNSNIEDIIIDEDKTEIPTLSDQPSLQIKKENFISFSNSFLASIFSSAIIFFLILFFIFMGSILGGKII